MTTFREFEDKKQEICDYIVKNIATSAKINHVIHVDKMLNELQPPRPTCSSCKELAGLHLQSCLDIVCHKEELTIYDPDIQNCIHHSDYEVIK